MNGGLTLPPRARVLLILMLCHLYLLAFLFSIIPLCWASQVAQSTCQAGDMHSIPGLRRSSGEGNGNPLQYSCLGNPMDRRAWQAIVHEVAESWRRFSN